MPEPEVTGGGIAMITTALGTFTGALLGGIAKVRNVSKANKRNAVDISVTNTRVDAVEKRMTEEIKVGEATHKELGKSVTALGTANIEEHRQMYEKMNGIGNDVAATMATMNMMNTNLERLLAKE